MNAFFMEANAFQLIMDNIRNGSAIPLRTTDKEVVIYRWAINQGTAVEFRLNTRSHTGMVYLLIFGASTFTLALGAFDDTISPFSDKVTRRDVYNFVMSYEKKDRTAAEYEISMLDTLYKLATRYLHSNGLDNTSSHEMEESQKLMAELSNYVHKRQTEVMSAAYANSITSNTD